MYKTIIFTVLFGVKFFSSLDVREKHRLRVFEKGVLGRLFRPKRVEIAIGYRKLHKQETKNLEFLPNIITSIKSVGKRWTEETTQTTMVWTEG